MSYRVKTDVFEGPFDLLVYLIEHAQMSIYDIKIAEITDQYIAYMEDMKSLNIEIAGEFMALAATLIEIKSKMLLPRYKPDAQGVIAEDDPRTELVHRILEYKKFKTASEMLAQSEEYTRQCLTKPQEDIAEFVKTEEVYLELEISQFIRAFNLFLLKKKKIEEIHKNYGEIKRERISVEDKISRINRMLRDKGTFNFEKTIDDWEDKQEVIAAFIAILELLKLKTIKIKQHISFGAIMIERVEDLTSPDNAGRLAISESAESLATPNSAGIPISLDSEESPASFESTEILENLDNEESLAVSESM